MQRGRIQKPLWYSTRNDFAFLRPGRNRTYQPLVHYS